MVTGRLAAGTGTSPGSSARAWTSWVEAGREWSRELPNTSGEACAINAPARSALECRQALLARPWTWRSAADGTGVPWCLSRRIPREPLPPSTAQQHRALAHHAAGCSGNGSTTDAQQSHTPAPADVCRTPALNDLSALAQAWRQHTGNGAHSVRLDSYSSSGSSTGAVDGGTSSASLPPPLVERTCILLDQRLGSAAFAAPASRNPSPAVKQRDGGRAAGGTGVSRTQAAIATAVVDQTLAAVADLADIITCVASCLRTSASGARRSPPPPPPPDLARSLVAAATAAAPIASWPQTASMLQGLVRMRVMGKRLLDRILARAQRVTLDPATSRDHQVPVAHRGARPKRTSSTAASTPTPIPGGSAPSAMDTLNVLRALAALHALPAVTTAANLGGAMQRLMLHLQSRLSELPGPAPLLSLLRDVTACGWRHDREPGFLRAVADHLCTRPPPPPPAAGHSVASASLAAGAASMGSATTEPVEPAGHEAAAAAAAAAAAPSRSAVDLPGLDADAELARPPRLLALTPSQVVEVMDLYARAGVYHGGLMERGLDAVDRCLPALTPSQAARVAEACARFVHYRPALMRRLALHVAAHLPSHPGAPEPGGMPVAHSDVAAAVAALARCRVRDERFLDAVAMYAAEHAALLLEKSEAVNRARVIELEARRVCGLGNAAEAMGLTEQHQQRSHVAEVRPQAAAAAAPAAGSPAQAQALLGLPEVPARAALGLGGGVGVVREGVLSPVAARPNGSPGGPGHKCAGHGEVGPSVTPSAEGTMYAGYHATVICGAGGGAGPGNIAMKHPSQVGSSADRHDGLLDQHPGAAVTASLSASSAAGLPVTRLPMRSVLTGQETGPGGPSGTTELGPEATPGRQQQQQPPAATAVGALPLGPSLAAAGDGDQFALLEALLTQSASEAQPATLPQPAELQNQPAAALSTHPPAAASLGTAELPSKARDPSGASLSAAAAAVAAGRGEAPSVDAAVAGPRSSEAEDGPSRVDGGASPAANGSAPTGVSDMSPRCVRLQHICPDRTGLVIRRLSPALQPRALLDGLLAVPGACIDLYYMPYDYAAVSRGRPGVGCAFVGVTAPEGVAALARRLQEGPVCGGAELAVLEYLPPSDSHALLRALLNPLSGYGPPRTDTSSRPLLLYVSGSLRGKVQPLELRDVEMYDLRRIEASHHGSHHGTFHLPLLPQLQQLQPQHRQAAPAPAACVPPPPPPPPTWDAATQCAAAQPTRSDPTFVAGSEAEAAASARPTANGTADWVAAWSAPVQTTGPAHVTHGSVDSTLRSHAMPDARRGGGSHHTRLCDAPQLALIAHSMAVLPYHSPAMLERLGRLMLHLLQPAVADPRLATCLLPPPEAPEAPPLPDDALSSPPTKALSSPPTKALEIGSADDAAASLWPQQPPEQRPAGPRPGPPVMPPLKSVLHALHALASQPRPDPAMCGGLADVCASALFAWVPLGSEEDELAAPRPRQAAPALTSPPSGRPGAAAAAVHVSASGALSGGASSGSAHAGASSLAATVPVAAAALPPRDVLDVHVRLLAQALTAAADHGPALYHPRLCNAAAALLRHHLRRLRVRAACALLQPLVRLRHPPARQLVAAVAPLLAQDCNRLSASSLVDLAWACARTGLRDTDGSGCSPGQGQGQRRVVVALAARARQLLHELPTPGLVQVFWALAALGHEDGRSGDAAGSGAATAAGGSPGGGDLYWQVLQVLLQRYDIGARDLLLLQEGLDLWRRLQQQQKQQQHRGLRQLQGACNLGVAGRGTPAEAMMEAFLRELISRMGSARQAAAAPAPAGSAAGVASKPAWSTSVSGRAAEEEEQTADPGAWQLWSSLCSASAVPDAPDALATEPGGGSLGTPTVGASRPSSELWSNRASEPAGQLTSPPNVGASDEGGLVAPAAGAGVPSWEGGGTDSTAETSTGRTMTSWLNPPGRLLPCEAAEGRAEVEDPASELAVGPQRSPWPAGGCDAPSPPPQPSPGTWSPRAGADRVGPDENSLPSSSSSGSSSSGGYCASCMCSSQGIGSSDSSSSSRQTPGRSRGSRGSGGIEICAMCCGGAGELAGRKADVKNDVGADTDADTVGVGMGKGMGTGGLLQQILIARRGLALEEAGGVLMRLRVMPEAVVAGASARARALSSTAA